MDKKKDSNVIMFPNVMKRNIEKRKHKMPPEFKKQQVENFIKMFMEDFEDGFVTQVSLAGFNTDNNDFIDGAGCILQLIEVLLYKNTGIEHPFGSIMEVLIKEVFGLEGDGLPPPPDDEEVSFEEEEDET